MISNFYFKNFEYNEESIKKIFTTNNVEESLHSHTNQNTSNLLCCKCKKQKTLLENSKNEGK